MAKLILSIVVAEIRRLTRKMTKLYEMNIAKEAKLNPKKFWKYVNSQTKIHKKIPDLYKGCNTDGNVLTANDKEKADTLAGFLSTVFTREPDGIWEHLQTPEITREFNLIINEDMVLKQLQKLKVTKSPGPDGIHPRVLREVSHNIAQPLTYIFNTSIRTGIVPPSYGRKRITQLFKKK